MCSGTFSAGVGVVGTGCKYVNAKMQTILSMFHDANATVRCLAMETLTRIYADKKDDKAILNQIFDQVTVLFQGSALRKHMHTCMHVTMCTA